MIWNIIEIISEILSLLESNSGNYRIQEVSEEKEENNKRSWSIPFLIIAIILSIAFSYLSSAIFQHQKIILILGSIIGISIIFNLTLIFLLIHFKIVQPTTFGRFMNYFIGLILFTSSSGLFIIDYFNFISNWCDSETSS